MVVGEDARLFVGKDPQGAVNSGEILEFTDVDGDWFFIPRRNAWIKNDSVVPLEKAEAHFTTRIDAEPTADAYHHRGIAREALGFHELAMRDLDEAVRLGLKSPALFINRANVWHSLGNHENAISDITQAIEAEPKNALAYNNRSLFWAATGNLERALEDVSGAIRINPDFPEAFNNRGVTRVKMGEFAAAIKDYDEAIRLNASYADAFANRGYAAKRLGDYEQALSDYRRAVELAPRSPQAFNDAAWLVATCPVEKLRDSKRAVQYARYACELTDFTNGEYVDTLAAAYAAAGEYEKAVTTQQQALTLLPATSHKSARDRLELYRKEQPYIESR